MHRSEARRLFDEGATVSQVAAETGCSYSTAAYICQTPAPVWPTLSPETLASLPEHLRREVEASNPNHRKG